MAEYFLPLFKKQGIELIGHDLKELAKVLQYNYNFILSNDLFDVMVASDLLNPGTRAHDSTSVLLKVLGKALPQSSAQTNLFGFIKKVLHKS